MSLKRQKNVAKTVLNAIAHRLGIMQASGLSDIPVNS
jgi:hypothetical protein